MRIRFTLVLAAVSVSLLGLTACGTTTNSTGSSAPTDSAPEKVQSDSDHEIAIEQIVGDTRLDRVSILCLDGSAFLIIQDNTAGSTSVERFPEQDKTCNPTNNEGQ